VAEDRSPAVCGVTCQIDQDVDTVGMDTFGGAWVRRVPDVDETIKGAGRRARIALPSSGPQE
jgi:hypothetical protein